MKYDVCRKELKWNVETPDELYETNGAVIGEYIKISGHKECCNAIDKLVVIPNRINHQKMFGGNLK